MKKYKVKEKQIITAIKWTGDNTDEIIKFGTITIDFKDHNYIEQPYDFEYIVRDIPELWISNWYGGDIIYIGEYAAIIDNEYVKLTEEEINENWESIDNNKYVQKNYPIIEAIQWLDNNTDECLAFLNHNGNTDATGQQILIMNSNGGAVCNKGDFILKFDDEYYSTDRDKFINSYEEI